MDTKQSLYGATDCISRQVRARETGSSGKRLNSSCIRRALRSRVTGTFGMSNSTDTHRDPHSGHISRLCCLSHAVRD
jgi:hypothetical protein